MCFLGKEKGKFQSTLKDIGIQKWCCGNFKTVKRLILIVQRSEMYGKTFEKCMKSCKLIK